MVQNDWCNSFVSWRTTSSPRPRLTLLFVSFLSRYPSDTDNQIYSNSETSIWNPILLVLILCTASFEMCLWSSPCIHQYFAHYHSIETRKISNIGGLSLVSSWKPYLFYRPFCYLQNVDFEGSRKTVLNYCALNTVITDQIIFSSILSNHG